MSRVIVIGGGWAGCSAAISARKAGAEVTLLERTDILLGLGNVGGIMRNNGRYTATEEAIALGARELFEITDEYATHTNMDFPGHKHATIYNVTAIEKPVRDKLISMGIDVRFFSRVVDVKMNGKRLEAVVLEEGVTWCGNKDEKKPAAYYYIHSPQRFLVKDVPNNIAENLKKYNIEVPKVLKDYIKK